MEKLSSFPTTPRHKQWLLYAFIAIIAVSLYQQSVPDFFQREHEGALSLLLYYLTSSKIPTQITNLISLASFMFLYNSLRESVKKQSKIANYLCWVILIAKTINSLMGIYTYQLSDTSFTPISGFYEIHFVLIVFSFIATVWLSCLLISRYCGIVKTLGIVWLITALIPQLFNLIFMPLDSTAIESLFTDFMLNTLVLSYDYIYPICALLPLWLIYRCHKIKE